MVCKHPVRYSSKFISRNHMWKIKTVLNTGRYPYYILSKKLVCIHFLTYVLVWCVVPLCVMIWPGWCAHIHCLASLAHRRHIISLINNGIVHYLPGDEVTRPGVSTRNTQLWLAERKGFLGFCLWLWFLWNGGIPFKKYLHNSTINPCLNIIWLWFCYGFVIY